MIWQLIVLIKCPLALLKLINLKFKTVYHLNSRLKWDWELPESISSITILNFWIYPTIKVIWTLNNMRSLLQLIWVSIIQAIALVISATTYSTSTSTAARRTTKVHFQIWVRVKWMASQQVINQLKIVLCRIDKY